MNALKLVAYISGKEKDISAVTGNYQKSDNLESLGECLSFDLVSNPLDKYMDGNALSPGDKVVFSDQGEVVFSGIVVDASSDGLYKRSYKCYDYGFYLNRNKVFVQFNGYSTTNAIKRVCAMCNIPVGKICSMGTQVWGIYEGKTVADVIKDLLSKHKAASGKRTRLEVRSGKLCIEHYTDMTIKAQFKPADNVAAFDPTKVIGSLSISESIESLRNSVKIVCGTERFKAVEASAKDSKSIKAFGLLTEVVSIDDRDYFRAPTIAKNKLKELNKVTREYRCTLLGDNRVRAGRVLVFDQAVLGLSGKMLVKNAEHSWTGATHTMSLELSTEVN